MEKFNIQNRDIIITDKNNSYNVKKRTFVNKEDVFEENGKLLYNAFAEGNSKSIIDFSTNDGTNVLNNVMDTPNIFDNPKNLAMLEYLIKLIPDKNATILDSFAGSGTTAHAVLNLNKKDEGNRKFILTEMEDYAETITAERVKRVGGSFEYFSLGERLFDDEGNLNEAVGIERIREYVWFTETRHNLLPKSSAENDYFLGKNEDTAYYFYYEPSSATVLGYAFLESIKTTAQQYVIYADNCTLSDEFLTAKSLIFKKIPRDITRF